VVVVVVVVVVVALLLLVLLCQWLAPRATIVEAWAARHYAATSVFK
jgi:type II secretory pathway pseudopilin PulG